MPLPATPITQIMQTRAVALEVSGKLSEAARMLAGGKLHQLPIVDRGHLVGVLDSADLVGLSAGLLDDDDPVTREFLDRHYDLPRIMEKNVVTVNRLGTLADAAECLATSGRHSVPVVDDELRLVGLVTTSDLVACFLDDPDVHLGQPEAWDAAGRRYLANVLIAAQRYLRCGLNGEERKRMQRAIELARSAQAA
jgi:CBS domain-containing protein